MSANRGTLASIAVVALIACGLLVSSSHLIAGGCDDDVTLEVSIAGEEPVGNLMHYQFSVDVATGTPCAKIIYDLILEVQIPNGQVKKVRKIRDVKLNDGSLSEIVRHKMSMDSQLLDYEVVLVECNVC